MIVVTGATGHIGNVVVRELLAGGEKVRALVLADEDMSALNGLNVEIVAGDVRNLESLVSAFRGARIVYHLAGVISIVPGKQKLLQEVNVTGTKNVISACFKTGVRRLVYSSSIHAIKEPPHGTVIDESQPFDSSAVPDEYAKSKAAASLEVLKAVEQGLDAVIVCPTGVIGPHDSRVSEMGQLILDFINRKLKSSVKGAYDFVDVRDVAHGMILAGNKGRAGESYILSGERISISDLLTILETATGIKKPSFQAPVWLARIMGVLAGPYYRLLKLKPLFTPYSVSVLASNSLISSAKARRELGYTSRTIRESITDAIAWFREEAKRRCETRKVNGNYCPA